MRTKTKIIKSMETLKKVQLFIENNQLLSPECRVIIGVSGGVDSVVLLNILSKCGYDCIVAHCNFHLRAEESDRDELFVADLAKKNNLQYKKIDFDTLNYAKHHKISIEMAARDLRYSWFSMLQTELDAESIAVAHHSDDSVETMLINSVRGSGLKGLCGIEARNGNIVRPLLCCSREEIENYAKKNGLTNIIDSTNAASDYLRNKFRNEIIPALEIINPSVKQTFLENMSKLRGVSKIYNEKIQEIKREISFTKENQLYIDIPKLKQQADVNTVLYELLQAYQFKNNIIDDICIGLNNPSGARYYSETYCILKDRNYLIVDKIEVDRDYEYLIEAGTSEIEYPISLTFKDFQKIESFQVSKNPEKIHIDADSITYPLTLRHWRNGDSFYPFGMNRKKKVSDFFIDEKINRFEKEYLWMLLSEGNIVWITGLRLDNRFRVTELTKNVLEISII